MAYFVNQLKSWLVVAFLGLAFACFLIARCTSHQLQGSPPVFLVTGDFKKGGNFAADVFKGADAALDTIPSSVTAIKPNILSLDTDSNTSEEEFRNSFLHCYTTRNIRAIISADISTVAPLVLKTATSYGIPVLLTVATNDDILAERRGDRGFRLVPTDTKQADLLADWLRSKATPAIIHGGQTPYGRFLASETIQRLSRVIDASKKPVITTDYVAGTDLFNVLVPMKSIGVDAIVFIGYSDRFRELYAKLTSLELKASVLLSDGCYAPSLFETPPEGDFALSFPVNPARRPNGIQGNGLFGHDACILLTYTMADMHERLVGDTSFGAAFRRTAKKGPVRQMLLASNYDFDPSGENAAAHFEIFPFRPNAQPK